MCSDSRANGLQVLQFSTASHREKERIAAWREELGRALLTIDITPRSKEAFQASATTYRSAGFGLLDVSMSAAYQANSRSLITSDDVSFGVVTDARWGASQLGRSADLHPGKAALSRDDGA
jgi:hypothetical protein